MLLVSLSSFAYLLYLPSIQTFLTSGLAALLLTRKECDGEAQ